MKKTLLLLALAVGLNAQIPTTLQKNPNNATSGSPNRLTDPSKTIIVPATGSITADAGGVIAATSIPGITIATTAPLTGGGALTANRTIAIPASTNSVDGYLTAADHATFAGKENVLTFSAPLSRSVNAVSIPAATGSVNGYLTSADWATFNAKQPAGSYITALTGDGTAAGPGSVAFTLATVNANVGTFGSAAVAAVATVNGKGLITAISNVTITPAVGSITGLGTGVASALGVNVGTAGAFVVNGGALGTPSSGTLTNATGLPISGISGLGSGVATLLAGTSSGTVGIAGTTSPTFITPTLGVASATSVAHTGTAGAGFASFVSQSSTPATPASGYLEFADSTGRRSWRRASDGFVRTWDATLTADRVYTLQDASGTIAFVSTTVPSIAGTAGNVLVNGGTTAVAGSAVTLSLPSAITGLASITGSAGLTLNGDSTGAVLTLGSGVSGQPTFSGGTGARNITIFAGAASGTQSGFTFFGSNTATNMDFGQVTYVQGNRLELYTGANGSATARAITISPGGSITATFSVGGAIALSNATISGSILGSGGTAPTNTTSGSNIFTAGVATSGPGYFGGTLFAPNLDMSSNATGFVRFSNGTTFDQQMNGSGVWRFYDASAGRNILKYTNSTSVLLTDSSLTVNGANGVSALATKYYNAGIDDSTTGGDFTIDVASGGTVKMRTAGSGAGFTFSSTGVALTGSVTAGAGARFSGSDTRSTSVSNVAINAFGSSDANITMVNQSGATNAKAWDINAQTSSITFRAVNDALNSATGWLTVNRSGTTISSVVFSTASGATALTLGSDQSATVGGNLTVSGTGTSTFNSNILNVTNTLANNPRVGALGSDTASLACVQVGLNAAAAGSIGARLYLQDSGTSGNVWSITSGGATAGRLSIIDNTNSSIRALEFTPSTLVATFGSTTSGTSTTAAAILGYSLGLQQNLYVGGSLNVTGGGQFQALTTGTSGQLSANNNASGQTVQLIVDGTAVTRYSKTGRTWLDFFGNPDASSPTIVVSDLGTPILRFAKAFGSSYTEWAQLRDSGLVLLQTTEATTGGAGAATVAGGFYATKKIISGSTYTSADPTNGSGEWMFGKVRTAVAATQSTTSVLEIKVDGVRYDVLVATALF